MLSDERNRSEDHLQRLTQTILERTKDFESIHVGLDHTYERWIKDLEKYRYENKLLQLLSNRQIMIMIILLTTSVSHNRVRQRFFDNVIRFGDLATSMVDKSKLTVRCLIHYLASLRMDNSDLSENNVCRLYEQYKIDAGSDIDTSLNHLGQFLRELFQNATNFSIKTMSTNENSEQYLVTLTSKERHVGTGKSGQYHDKDEYSVLLNLFRNRLPADYQILWCSVATEEDIRLFFLRVRTFPYLVFAVMHMDTMDHRLRTILLHEQNSLAKEKEPHAPIYYFSKELISHSQNLRPFYVTPQFRDQNEILAQFAKLLRQQNVQLPQIQIIYGVTGIGKAIKVSLRLNKFHYRFSFVIGKTHFIRTSYDRDEISCISINDQINLSSLISSFLTSDSNRRSLIHLNISIHASLEQLNRTFFSLFVCGSLHDHTSGLTFSVSIPQQWKYVIEVPYQHNCQLTPKEHFEQILPLLSIISRKDSKEITGENYPLFIGEQEELVGRLLKAYEHGDIDYILITTEDNIEQPIEFEPLQDANEVRQYIHNCIGNDLPNGLRNRISQLSFAKFLYRRVRFFTSFYYCYNTSVINLGSVAMRQMIQEARNLTQVDFSSDDYPRLYLVYDPNFSLHLLHNNWSAVPEELQKLFGKQDPAKKREHQNKNYLIECLAWLIDIKYDVFQMIMHDHKFILTENFAYKLFHIHERKLTQLPLIIEGETGIGKTFLLTFYSALLNAHICCGKNDDNITPRIIERTSLWLYKDIIGNILESQKEVLDVFLRKIRPKLTNLNNDRNNDEIEIVPALIQFEEENQNGDENNNNCNTRMIIKKLLQNHECDHTVLQSIWNVLMTVTSERDGRIANRLITSLHQFVTTCIADLPLIEPSGQLVKLLQSEGVSTVETSTEIFNEFLVHTRIKPVFYRLLLHPGVTEKGIADFLYPLCQLAQQVSTIELVVFFDEVNTSSCLGLFKEIFMDGTLHGKTLPKNIFFTAAINPAVTSSNSPHQVHRHDYLVHELPQSLKTLQVSYGILNQNTLEDYIRQKIATFTVNSTDNPQNYSSLEKYVQDILIESILKAQDFCEKRLGMLFPFDISRSYN